MRRLSGKPVAERIYGEIERSMGIGKQPTLSIHLAGGDEASWIYARSKMKKGEVLGMNVHLRTFDEEDGQDGMLDALKVDARDRSVHGIIIERPLPEGFDEPLLLEKLPPLKDIEGVTPENYGLMAMGRPRFIPPTPLGALLLSLHYGLEFDGKRVAVVGRSLHVGRPLSMLLSQKRRWANATVTTVHSRTGDLKGALKGCSTIFTAAGSPGLLTSDSVDRGCHIIDMGINPLENGSITGDADIASLTGWAEGVTPTPGGTGPVTVAALFLNLIRARSLLSGGSPYHDDQLLNELYTWK